MQTAPEQSTPGKPQAKKEKTSCLMIFLIALGISVPLLGVLSALAIYGVSKYIASAKTAEAKNTVGTISRAAVAAYGREVAVQGALGGETSPGEAANQLCSSAEPVPANIQDVAGRKYQPRSTPGVDFDTGTATSGWRCLKFSITQPTYYQYHYNAGSGYIAAASAPGPRGFEAAARGDLDGDAVLSTFSRTGVVNAQGQLVIADQITIENERE
ncbi:fimbiral protein pilA [Sorangium sp. So ce131]|uniref:fimbiral protein pilA n=1 Tax=Sorangium sp. So ce131 TaxID=3133282 RepID=UPI003F64517F